MPKLNGLEVLKAIKTDETLRNIPIVVFSSSSALPEVDEFYRQGANAYVVKPALFSDLVQVIKHLSAFWTHINVPPSSQKPISTL